MDGAGANDDKETPLGVCAIDDRDNVVPSGEDGGFGIGALASVSLLHISYDSPEELLVVSRAGVGLEE